MDPFCNSIWAMLIEGKPPTSMNWWGIGIENLVICMHNRDKVAGWIGMLIFTSLNIDRSMSVSHILSPRDPMVNVRRQSSIKKKDKPNISTAELQRECINWMHFLKETEAMHDLQSCPYKMRQHPPQFASRPLSVGSWFFLIPQHPQKIPSIKQRTTIR